MLSSTRCVNLFNWLQTRRPATVAVVLLCMAQLLFAAHAQDADRRGANLAGAATAAPADGDQRPELERIFPQYQLMGKGRLSVWGFQVYDARLWAAPGYSKDSATAQPFALELTYLRDFDNQDIAERSITEIRRSTPVSDGQAKLWMDEMMRVLPDVKKGDKLMGLNRPGAGAQFWLNGKPLGDIRDAEFARLFFGIWLSPKTSEPKLRNALLAGAQ